jgi:hypothetical protein
MHVKTHCIEAYNVHAHSGTLHELRWLALTLTNFQEGFKSNKS